MTNTQLFKLTRKKFKWIAENELPKICKNGSPWIFLCASAYLNFLSNLVNGSETTGYQYVQFIKTYLPKYNTFVYPQGQQDLPEQMYYVLRCGITHAYSLFPDGRGLKRGGRKRSITLCHKEAVRKEAQPHLMAVNVAGTQAALFVAEDFLNDLQMLTRRVFQKAAKNNSLRKKILNWVKAHPPITGGFPMAKIS